MNLLLYVSSVLCVASFGAYAESNLEMVHVFFRHGKRTPELKDSYPTDPYQQEAFMPMDWGQLTNAGKQQMYQFGKLLRDRYETFLGELYTPDLVASSSTDFDRTKMTLLLVLAGLFPPAPAQQWDSELMWNPIPIQFETHKHDYLIKRPNTYCPTYMKELEEVLGSVEYQRLVKEHRKTFQYVAKHTGKPMKELSDMFRIFQTLTSETNMNLTLPDWTKSVYPEPITTLAAKQCHFENYNEILTKLNGGHLLKKSIEHMQAKIDGDLQPKNRKIYLYSGHENNVLNILAALKVYEPHVPKFGSGVIMELHSFPDNTYGIKVFYIDQIAPEPRVMTLPDCEVLCPFDQFLRITENHVPTNYTEECHSDVFLN